MAENDQGLGHPVQLGVICGRNKELKRKRTKWWPASPPTIPVTLKVVGYTYEMDGYMAASDIVVGKLGGLRTAEALATVRSRGLQIRPKRTQDLHHQLPQRIG